MEECGELHWSYLHSKAHKTTSKAILETNIFCGDKTGNEILNVIQKNLDSTVDFLEESRIMKDVTYVIDENKPNNIEQSVLERKGWFY